MKKLFIAIAMLFCAIPAVAAQTFTWDTSPGAAGYRLFCGVNGGAAGAYNAAPVLDVPTNAAVTTTMAPGKYRCAMKAYRPAGAVCGTTSAVSNDCTAYSNEVLADIPVPIPPLPAPTNLKFVVTLACDGVTHLCTMQIAQIPVP